MLLNDIHKTVQECQVVANELKIAGINRASVRFDKFIKLLGTLNTSTEAEIKKKLSSKPYKTEIDFITSAVTDIKGLKDMCPSQLKYEDWRDKLSKLRTSLAKLK
ncbi:hypothetical protein HQQ94_01020 [Shewanella sp. VB17]|uniref:hypothetical protein n=1 Tax=Shewanella sp. VB17 TaxID=2739432 RepID=UPI0015636EB7|nr:hypothetical protein [Shewanella sp. VB17]NRD71848.1 hypothetical protein [Shewanella sp. VB17]